MDRRAFLGAIAAGATASALKATAAERPLGETGVPLQGSEPLPLGPLPGGRYPDPHVESLKKAKGAFGQTGFRSHRPEGTGPYSFKRDHWPLGQKGPLAAYDAARRQIMTDCH